MNGVFKVKILSYYILRNSNAITLLYNDDVCLHINDTLRNVYDDE